MEPNKKFAILSAQKWKDYYPLQVVYEWENIIAETLSIPLDVDSQIEINHIFDKPASRLFQKFVRHSFLKNFIDISNNYLLRKKRGIYFINFHLYVAETVNHYVYQPNSIPIIIDCFRDKVDLVPILYRKNPLVFVTDIEVFTYLQATSIAPKLKFVPLSISNKYLKKKVPAKKIDVLQMGRQNTVLHHWMMELTAKHPSIEYVYAKRENDKQVYWSTTRGLLDVPTETREQFMAFLGSARISLVSSPGVDDHGTVTRTGGFNPVTPRFYESAVNYCYMIGRFPDAPDFIYNKVASVCERPDSYEAFEQQVLSMLATPFNQQERYRPFIQQHLTGTIAMMLKKELDQLQAQ